MKRIRKWLAFTIAFVMLVNTSYVQSLPVFATELQTDSQPSAELNSDSVESVSEDTGNLEEEAISESGRPFYDGFITVFVLFYWILKYRFLQCIITVND